MSRTSQCLRGLLPAILVFLCLTSAWAEDTDASFRNGRALLAEGHLRSDVASLTEARDIFVGLARDRELESAARYFAAVTYYRMYEIANRENESTNQLVIFLDHGILQARGSFRRDKGRAEAHAIFAIFYAVKVGMFPEVESDADEQALARMRHARELEPENPRVALLEGLGIYRWPQVFGGDADQALELLEKAGRLFRRQKSGGADEPEWGHAETLAWIGLIHLDQGNVVEADKAFRKALKIDEEYDWVKTYLLPRVAEGAEGGS